MSTSAHNKNQELWAKDDSNLKNRIREVFYKSTNNKNIKLPANIWLEEIDNGIKMSLSLAAIGKGKDKYLNMQDNAAAFEGWAVSIYTHYLAPMNNKDLVRRKIILGLQEKLDNTQDTEGNSGHYNRFLYRAMRFTEEYSEWIGLDSNLEEALKKFKECYKKENFINNKPSKKRNQKFSEATGNPKTEDEVERLFAFKTDIRRELLDRANMKTEKLYRQLPVGLFKGKPIKEHSFFTGGKSAIDLWAIDEKYIALFELKTNNKMIGIITELFFYSEYINDIFINRKNIQCADSDDKESGYYYLASDETPKKKIKAYFLTNGLHPLITNEVIEVLNNGKKGKGNVINYARIEYNWFVDFKI